MVGHRLMGSSLYNGRRPRLEARAHFDQAIALYDPATIAPSRRDLGKTSV